MNKPLGSVREIYLEAMIGKHTSLVLLIDYLVKDKQVLKLEDPQERLTYFLQDRFQNKMNEYLKEYEVKRNG